MGPWTSCRCRVLSSRRWPSTGRRRGETGWRGCPRRCVPLPTAGSSRSVSRTNQADRCRGSHRHVRPPASRQCSRWGGLTRRPLMRPKGSGAGRAGGRCCCTTCARSRTRTPCCSSGASPVTRWPDCPRRSRTSWWPASSGGSGGRRSTGRSRAWTRCVSGGRTSTTPTRPRAGSLVAPTIRSTLGSFELAWSCSGCSSSDCRKNGAAVHRPACRERPCGATGTVAGH